jgi:hypothetical protein
MVGLIPGWQVQVGWHYYRLLVVGPLYRATILVLLARPLPPGPFPRHHFLFLLGFLVPPRYGPLRLTVVRRVYLFRLPFFRSRFLVCLLFFDPSGDEIARRFS